MTSTDVADFSGISVPRWHVVVPVKQPLYAKSRLAEALGERRAGFALALAHDTVRAALSCEVVADVAVVTADERVAAVMKAEGAHIVDDGGAPGLNDAITHALGTEPLDIDAAVLLGDLPALTPEALQDALMRAARFDTAFVPDAAGTGTTLLCVRRGRILRPRFGAGSARAHAQGGAIELVDVPDSLRRDVDSLVDLAEAERIGLGRFSRELLHDIDFAHMR
jgi:2-phospho-L-lactate/phosphoenolpyruvate guanylyltransferase